MTLAQKTPDHHTGTPSSPGNGKRVTRAVMASVMAFAYLCSKKACQVAKKLKPAPGPGDGLWRENQSPRSPMIQRPKQLLATISNKAITLVQGKKTKSSTSSYDDDVEEDFKGGVWQRSILMGDKCQPLDFSGVIYYDSHGKQTTDLPIRSPRASPMPSYFQTTQSHF